MNARTIVVGLAVVAVGAGAWVVGERVGTPDREVTTSSEEAFALYEEGRGHLERYDLEQAAAAFEAAAEADTNFAMAYLQLGQALSLQGQTIRGRVEIREAFDKRDHASEIERLWIERYEASRSAKKAAADSITNELVSRFGDHPWVLRLRGDRARANAEYEKALEFYDRALTLDPEAVDLHNLKGYVYLAMGDYDDAVQSLQRYAFYAPDQANPHDSLGEAYFYTGRFEDATKEFLRALEIDPSFVWAAVHLSDVLSVTGQVERAHRVLDEIQPLMEERGWHDWHQQTRLTIDLRAQRWNDVIARADAVLGEAEIASKPTEFAVFASFVRTMSYLELGELDRAREALAELQNSAGEFFEEQSREAKWFEAVARLNRAVLAARLARAEGRPEDGIEDLAAAIDESGRSPHELAFFRNELVESQYAAGDYEAAAATADEALERIPTLPSLNLAAARAKVKLGERDEALAHLRTYLQVMRFADEGLPQLARAQRLLQRIVPRS